jgi:hypothetical protein
MNPLPGRGWLASIARPNTPIRIHASSQGTSEPVRYTAKRKQDTAAPTATRNRAENPLHLKPDGVTSHAETIPMQRQATLATSLWKTTRGTVPPRLRAIHTSPGNVLTAINSWTSQIGPVAINKGSRRNDEPAAGRLPSPKLRNRLYRHSTMAATTMRDIPPITKAQTNSSRESCLGCGPNPGEATNSSVVCRSSTWSVSAHGTHHDRR